MVSGVRAVRWLVLTASMGSGHDQVAHELAGRLRRRSGEVLVVDLLRVLPGGAALRAGYAGMLRHAPWLYEAIFRAFFSEGRYCRPGVFPLDRLAARRLRGLLARYRPDVVVSTFHLAAQVAGHMRVTGLLPVPSVVVITEPAAHRQWLARGTDLFLCPYPWVAEQARARTGIPALAAGPVVGDGFHLGRDPAQGRAALGLGAGERAVLVSAGSWGVGSTARTARALSALPDVRTVVLCGRNAGLRREIDRLPGCQGLGWRDDVDDLLAAASVLVDQSGGTACAEAFAAGIPVVLHRPLPGHGRLGATALAAHGVVSFAADADALREQVRRLSVPGRDRDVQVARAHSVFVDDAVEALLTWSGGTGFTPRRVAAERRSAASSPARPSRRSRSQPR
jgi:UDP-N-acetylglucosamine:LPS N-acetylglucosamine transferase